MFTGITEEIGKVISTQASRLIIGANIVTTETKHGDSISINGVCLTVTDFNTSTFSVDIMPETLERTNLGLLRPGDRVNLERPLTLNGRIGGHLVQGHIDDTGRITSITWHDETMLIRVEAPATVMRFTVLKGFIAVDGISLTITDRDTGSFCVSVVNYTREHTILGSKRAGDLVNLEVDIIAKYVAQFSQAPGTGITADFLQEHGFLVS